MDSNMNERIRQLAVQAGFGYEDYKDIWYLNNQQCEEEIKKFAELIVREMCQVMKAEGEQFSLDQNFDAVKGVGRCMRKVKEHFGVE
jgi:hypothetical protein